MTSVPTPLTPNQLAAHSLLSELRTRIAVQPLPYQYGIETRALESLWEIFGLARNIMKGFPGCKDFAQITTDMLNTELRPVTAKWHRAHQAGVLDSKDGANEFRIDLNILRLKLIEFCEQLQLMAYGEICKDKITPPVVNLDDLEKCFTPIEFGIPNDILGKVHNFCDINTSEAAEIQARRKYYSINKPERTDAVGLSLSGGGIRSATFCLGVVQVLSEKKIMKDFDYLSTVSGGGYIGSFITSTLSQKEGYEAISKPYGPDTDSIRHIRQNAKYLSAANLKQRWMMVTGALAGLTLNLTTPIGMIAVIALISNYTSTLNLPSFWLCIAGFFGGASIIGIIVYGIGLRFGWGAKAGSSIVSVGAGAILIALLTFIVSKGYESLGEFTSDNWQAVTYLAALALAIPLIAKFIPIFNSLQSKNLLQKYSLILAAIIVPLISIALLYILKIVGSLSQISGVSWLSGQLLLTLIIAICAITSLCLNVNLTGLHKLYRDQLAKTFVENNETSDDLPLNSVNSNHRAPYHLINTTVNLPSSKNRILRDRRGDFFIFSKHWCGSAATGYSSTGQWESNGTAVDLATAMAISGAAVSPQMGPNSVSSLSALMTLLNLRLGYWISNPKIATKKSPSFLCLFREMTGIGMNETNPWLNLSDGGHIENMGIYELLRRRCKFIVCVDGEADPRSTFEGQLTLVRHAQIDFGVRLEPRLDDIRLDPKSTLSRTHSHLLRIHYPDAGPDKPGAIGLMLYLKLSLTGDETELLKRYRSISPDFPHESTLDQFYTEEQFEAYRQLGVHVAEGVFSQALLDENATPADVSEWFKQLAKNMLEPTNNL
ncbi:patatin-like phospholipase family protein [Pseudomonas kitaguniensis]|uniref:patatin-like phospholipase family protein n=1 Tax=Pseudomonas kitaguniensis TaxID=2607908 RepID=UPI003CFF0308